MNTDLESAHDRPEAVTDIMMRVSDLASSESLFVSTLGLLRENAGEGWTMLSDPSTHQRLVLAVEDFGADWALAISSRDLQFTTANLKSLGARSVKSGTSSSGFDYELFAFSGLNVLLYNA